MHRCNVVLSVVLSIALCAQGIFAPKTAYAEAGEIQGRQVVDTAELTISYRLEGTNNLIHETYKAELPTGERYEIASPQIDGFKLTDSKQAVVAGVLDADASIDVGYSYAADTAQYVIEYVGIDASDHRHVLDSMVDEAQVGSQVSVPHREFKGWKRRSEELSLTVTADGMAKKTLFYEPIYDTYILFDTNGSPVDPIHALPGTDISDKLAALPTPVREGYEFAGWDVELPDEMPTSDMVATAQWTPVESEYSVLYWFQEVEGDDYRLNHGLTQQRTATTESAVTASDADKAQADTNDETSPFYGFDFSRADSVPVEGNGNTVVNVYYDREIWTVNLYKLCVKEDAKLEELKALYNNKTDSDIWMTFKGRYDAPLPDSYPGLSEQNKYYANRLPEEWTAEGYRFIALWDVRKRIDHLEGVQLVAPAIPNIIRFNNESSPGMHRSDLFPVCDTDVYPFEVTIYQQTLDMLEYSTQREALMTAGTPQVSLTVSPADGFTFEGGSYRTAESRSEMRGSAWVPVNVKDIQDNGKVKFRQIEAFSEFRTQRNTYNLEYMSDGELIRTVQSIPFEKPLEEYLSYVPSEAPEGMKFAGWYESPDLFDVVEPLPANRTMPANNMILYAKWVPTDVTVSFETQTDALVAPQTFVRGGSAVEPDAPVREGHEFQGWFTAPDGGERWNFDQDVRADMTLYAQWRRIDAITVAIEHYMQGEDDPFFTQQLTGIEGDTLLARALRSSDEGYPQGAYLKPDFAVKSVPLEHGRDHVVRFTYVDPAQREYTIRCRDRATGEDVRKAQRVTCDYSIQTLVAPSVDGYRPEMPYQVFTVSDNAEATFWYMKSEQPDPEQPDPEQPDPEGSGPEQPNPNRPNPEQPGDPNEQPDAEEPGGNGGDADAEQPDNPDDRPDAGEDGGERPELPSGSGENANSGTSGSPDGGENASGSGEEYGPGAPAPDSEVLPATGDAPSLLAAGISVLLGVAATASGKRKLS